MKKTDQAGFHLLAKAVKSYILVKDFPEGDRQVLFLGEDFEEACDTTVTLQALMPEVEILLFSPEDEDPVYPAQDPPENSG